jgi:hypothetical protein
MILEPERAALLLAERPRRPPADPAGPGRVPPAGDGRPTSAAGAGDDSDAPANAGGIGHAGLPGGKEWLVQRTLEELGIHCEANGALQDLKGFLIASPRGAEIVVSDRLDAEERLTVYAHLLAHALLEEDAEKANGFFSRLEYVEGREPPNLSSAERRADHVADAIAEAILDGRLDATPQYAYKRKRRRDPVGNTGLRPALGRFFLEMSHRTSLALFWYLPQYRKLRSRPQIAVLVRYLETLTRVAYDC